jgi:ABC-type transport system substrate-binding protein
VYKSRDDDSWKLEANPNYWNPDAPYVDSLENVWLVAWTPENTAALLGGVTDWTMWLAPKDGRTIGDNPGINAAFMNSFTQGIIPLNVERKPFDDARVRRAFMLAIDTQALLEVGKDVAALDWGEYFVKGTPYAVKPSLLQDMPGFRPPTEEDIATARQLLVDAGYPNGEGIQTLDLLTRETVSERLWAPAMQAMLKANLNVDTDIRIVDISAVLEEKQQGTFDIAVLAASKSLAGDPSDYLRNAFGLCSGNLCGNNFSRWRSPEFNSLMDKFDVEVDLEKKIALTDQIRDLLLQEVPAIPVSNSEIVYWGWWDHLKGMMPAGSSFFTWYELHKWDNVWLDR